MAKVPPITLKEVREKLEDKLYEALDFLADMEETKKNIFRKPDEARNANKQIGSDTTWVYLRAARDDTIHIEQTDLVHLTRVTFTVRLHPTMHLRVEVINHETGTVTVSEGVQEPPTPPEYDETKVEKDLWEFRPIELVDTGGNITDIIDYPRNDVVSICRDHINKLIALVDECAKELTTYS